MVLILSVLVVNDETFHSEVSEGLVLVDFYADWCGPCKMLSPVLDELAVDTEGKLKILKVNIDDSTSVSGEYGIMSIPTLLVFKDGEVVNKVSGFKPKEALLGLVGLD